MAIARNYFITVHHQTGIHFENFTEVKFRDILLTGTGTGTVPAKPGRMVGLFVIAQFFLDRYITTDPVWSFWLESKCCGSYICFYFYNSG